MKQTRVIMRAQALIRKGIRLGVRTWSKKKVREGENTWLIAGKQP